MLLQLPRMLPGPAPSPGLTPRLTMGDTPLVYGRWANAFSPTNNAGDFERAYREAMSSLDVPVAPPQRDVSPACFGFSTFLSVPAVVSFQSDKPLPH
jgi:hypothetical protein